MSGFAPLPESVWLSGLLAAVRARMSPEVRQAVVTIVDALIEQKPTAAEAAPRTPRCRSIHVSGRRCSRHGSHSGEHRSGGIRWPMAKRVTKKRKAKRK